MITPKHVSAIAASGLKRLGPILFRGAREVAKRVADRDKVSRVKRLSESERTPQEVTTLAKDQSRKEYKVVHGAACYKAKEKAKMKEAEEKGLKPLRTYRKPVSWEDRFVKLRLHKATHGNLRMNALKCGTGLVNWRGGQHSVFKKEKLDQNKIGLLRDISFSFNT